MFYSRDIARRISGLILALVFVFGTGLETFHTHPVVPDVSEDCAECESGHHSGHLSSLAGEMHDCLICRAASLPFIESCGPDAVTRLATVIFLGEDPHEDIPLIHSLRFSSRAPPVEGSICC